MTGHRSVAKPSTDPVLLWCKTKPVKDTPRNFSVHVACLVQDTGWRIPVTAEANIAAPL